MYLQAIGPLLELAKRFIQKSKACGNRAPVIISYLNKFAVLPVYTLESGTREKMHSSSLRKPLDGFAPGILFLPFGLLAETIIELSQKLFQMSR